MPHDARSYAGSIANWPIEEGQEVTDEVLTSSLSFYAGAQNNEVGKYYGPIISHIGTETKQK